MTVPFWKGRVKMEKRRLEKLGIETSLLGFGCMRFPVTAEGKIREPEAEEMMDRAIKAGVNYIDTAYPYHDGQSEPFVGKVMSKYDRNSYYLATKLPCWHVNALEDVDRIFSEQLSRLRTDYIDFYLMHALNRDSFRKMAEMGCVKRLEELKAQGKIKYLGFSFHDGYDAFEEILSYREWDFCQIQLNYMDADQQAGMKGYKLAEERQVPLVIMEPVKGGTLAAYADDITGRFRELDPQASVASFALRWVGSLPNVKVILSGMSTMGQLEENIRTFEEEKPLNDAEMERLLDIADNMINGVPCTACRYCTSHCPQGIDIPAMLKLYNEHVFTGGGFIAPMTIEAIPEEHRPGACVGCQSCEAVCPQQIKISEVLADFVQKLK